MRSVKDVALRCARGRVRSLTRKGMYLMTVGSKSVI